MRAEETPLVSADLNYASKYVFRGIERAGASAQAAVDFSKDDFHGGLSTNLPFASGQASEVDLGAAYSWQAGGGLTLEASARQYWFNNGPAVDARHSFETGLTAALASIGGLKPSLAYYHDFRLRADTWEASLAHSLALTSLGTFLDLKLFAGNSSGDDWRPDAPGPSRHDSYVYWGAEVQLPYNISYLIPHTTLVTGLHYTDSRGRSLTDGPFGLSGGQNFWVTLGVNLDF